MRGYDHTLTGNINVVLYGETGSKGKITIPLKKKKVSVLGLVLPH